MKRLTLLAFLLLLGGWSAKAQTAPGQTVGVITATGSTCATAGACVIAPLNNSTGSVGVSIANTFSGTVQFEVTTDNSNWVSVNCFPPSSTTAVTSTTAAGTWTCAVNGMVFFRARASAYSSGIIGVVITPSAAINASSVNGGGGGGGSVQPGAIHTPAVYTAANVVGPTPNCPPPSTNGTYDLLFDITASATTDVSCPQEGLAGTPGLTGATSTYTIAYSDNAQAVVHDAAGSAAIVATLPTPTTLGNPEFVTSYCNYSAFIDTITPTTWTINGQTSLTVPTNTCYRISVDPNNTALSKTNWIIGPAGPVINGISYSNLYPGATLDVRVNAAMADAEGLLHGNKSGIVDSTNEGSTQTIAAQITVGDGTHPVTWRLPRSCAWSATSGIGSTNYAILQNSQTNIEGLDASSYKCLITNSAGNLGIEGLFGNAGVVSNNGYYHARGFGLVNSATTGSGAVWWVNGGLDVTNYDHIGVSNNNASTVALLLNNGNPVCCAASFDHLELGGNFVGGTILEILSTGAGVAQRVSFTNSSFTHPAASTPIILISDTSADHNCAVQFSNIYEETNNTDTTTALNQVAGCGGVLINGMSVEAFSATASTATGWTISNAQNTSFQINNFEMGRNFSSPVTFVVNNFSGQTVTGTISGGENTARLSSYMSNPPLATASSLGYAECDGATTTCANGVITATSTASAAFSALTASINTNTGTFGFSAAGAASTPTFELTGVPFAGNGTTSIPYMLLGSGGAATSWSVNGTHLGFNAASGFTGNFIDFHINGGASLAFINSAGSFATTGVVQVGTAGTFGWASSSKWANLSNGTVEIENSSSSAGVVEASTFDSLVATGTAPLTIASTTVVPNLNVSQLLGGTWAIPGTIGSTTPNTGAFTTLSASSTVSGTGFSTYLASPPAIGGTAPAAGSFTALTGATLNTTTNCTSAASPAVCASASAGEVTVAAAASTITVNTTAVTANSEIELAQDISSNGGTRLSVTCNTTPVLLAVSAITAGTSFQITSASAALTNPDCIYYRIVN